jgi:pimeloyl-ACP methyl ester carboxylesterase
MSASHDDAAPDLVESLREAASSMGIAADEVVAPARREAVLNGLRLSFLDWDGPAAAPALVLLHGGGLTAHTWSLVCLQLRRRFRCLAPDLRGHGDSGWAPDRRYDLAEYAADLAALIEHLRLDRFVLVGHSLGGLTAMTYAAADPGRPTGLVLVDVGPEMSGPGRERMRAFAAERELDSIDAFVERALAFNPRRQPERLRRSLLHNLRQTPRGTWTWKHDPDRYSGAQQDPGRRPEVLWAAVAGITCPTLVVRGGDSDLFLDSDAEKLVRALPSGRLAHVPGAGHTVQGDQPRALADAITTFIDSAIETTSAST